MRDWFARLAAGCIHSIRKSNRNFNNCSNIELTPVHTFYFIVIITAAKKIATIKKDIYKKGKTVQFSRAALA